MADVKKINGYDVKDAVARKSLESKVDKVEGKGLSEEDFTSTEKSKLAGIESGAQANVQADWNETDVSKPSFIKHKPEDLGKVDDVKVNGESVVTDKIANITVPSLEGYATKEYVNNHHDDTKADKSEIPSLDGYATESYVNNHHDSTKQDTIPDLADIRSKAHTHSNKALLDTYTQTETDIADAVSKKHEHSNKSVLDATTASFTTETANTISTHSANIVALPHDVQINGTSILDENKIANIPFADENEAGVIKLNNTFGLMNVNNGTLAIKSAANNEISARNQYWRPIVPSNLDYAVKSAMCDGVGATWTDTEKASARTRMGVDSIERSLNSLWDYTQGVAWDFQTDSTASATKTIPSGARLCDVQMVGGMSTRDCSWAMIGEKVRNGTIQDVLSVGDQLEVKWRDGSTEYTVPLDIVHFGQVELEDGEIRNGMYLQWHYTTPFGMTFDEPEPTNPDTNIQQYGYNRWSQSAARKWLNSSANAGSWWSASTDYDVAPSMATTKDGFLKGFDADFLNQIKPIKVITQTNTVTDGGVTDVTYDKFFLPSKNQEFLTVQTTIDEGEVWDYWKRAYGNVRPVNYQNGAAVIRYSVANKTSAQTVWLRSAYRGSSYYEWYVSSNGYVSDYGARGGLALAPACVIC